jgi:CheY-like chemotaxis protein
MRRVFDDVEFEQLAADARSLAAQAAHHEHELAALVELVENLAGTTSVTAVGELSSADAGSPALLSLAGVDLLGRMRDLCVSARKHRLDAERYLRAFTAGFGANATGPARPRILIVDDAEDVREVLAIALAAAGLEPITAADGLEGLIAVHVARPEAILMDVNMPVLNGIEATRLLRAAASTRGTPVIAHTARPDLLAPPITQLFDHVVAKPAVPSDVVAALRGFLSEDWRTGPES